MTPPKKLWSDIKYWAILLIFFLVLFEMVSSMILFRKYTTGKFAISHFIERFSAGKPAHENYAYEPFLMFRLADHSSESVNVKGFERKSDPGISGAGASNDTIDVFFFGGANMYGRALSDNETIPSQFVKQYQALQPAKPLRVRNLGIPHYYSRQELTLLSKLIFEGQRPDIVVFLDGNTDFHDARMLYYDKPWFSYALQQTFEGKMFQKGDGRFVDSTNQFSLDPDGISAENYNAELIGKFTNNIRQAGELCIKNGIKPYFFIEPSPFYKNSHDQKNAKDVTQRFRRIYSTLEQNADSLQNFHFLGNMPANEPDDPFVRDDYSAVFAQKVAKQIFETLKPALQ